MASAPLRALIMRSLLQRESYREPELARLVGYMQLTIPQIIPHILTGSKRADLVLGRDLRDERMRTKP